jgi:hypothetical protein
MRTSTELSPSSLRQLDVGGDVDPAALGLGVTVGPREGSAEREQFELVALMTERVYDAAGHRGQEAFLGGQRAKAPRRPLAALLVRTAYELIGRERASSIRAPRRLGIDLPVALYDDTLTDKSKCFTYGKGTVDSCEKEGVKLPK